MVDDKTQCPIEECTREHTRRHLMCNPHWRMVPKELQGIVYRTARQMWGGEEGGVEAWEEARSRAIAAVEEKEADRAGSSSPIISEEPTTVLNALGQEFAEFMAKHGCRGFILMSKGREGGIVQTGYEEDEDLIAVKDLEEHFRAFMEARGFVVNIIWPESN